MSRIAQLNLFLKDCQMGVILGQSMIACASSPRISEGFQSGQYRQSYSVCGAWDQGQ